MCFPSNEEDWRKIAKEYEEMWQFPHCTGAIDGKHIALFNPVNSGSTYFNYKGFFSIVLSALIDADYKFTHVDIGYQGRMSDGGVFKNCELYKLLASNQANIPPPSPVNDLSDLNDSFLLESNREANIPYVIIADDVFPLTTYSRKPYSQKNLSDSRRILNYRLSRARRTSENAFGILSNRFRVLSSRIDLKPEIAIKVAMTCCLLHNLLRVRSEDTHTPQGFADEISEDGNVTEKRSSEE